MFALPTRCLLCAAIVLASAGSACAQNQAQNQYLSVHIGTAADSYALGSKVTINLDVTNTSTQKIVIPTNNDEPELGGFDFVIRPAAAPANSQVQLTPYMWEARGRTDSIESVKDPDEGLIWLGPVKGATSLAPSATVRFSTVLNNLYYIGKPGIYSIHARKWPRDGSGAIVPEPAEPKTQPVPVISNTIELTVSEPPPPTISLTLNTTAMQFPPGSQIDADLAVTNISTLPISLPLDPSDPRAERNGFKFSGVLAGASPSESVRRKANYWWKTFDYKYPDQQIVKPNQTVHYPVRLSSVLDLSTSGTYTIEAKKIDPVTHFSVNSTALTIVVGASIGLRAERDFQIDVLEDQGHSAPRTAYGKKIDGQVGLYSGSIGSHLLKRGGNLVEQADLSEIFDLTKPGSYTVRAKTSDNRNAVVVTSNSIIFTVDQ